MKVGMEGNQTLLFKLVDLIKQVRDFLKKLDD